MQSSWNFIIPDALSFLFSCSRIMMVWRSRPSHYSIVITSLARIYHLIYFAHLMSDLLLILCWLHRGSTTTVQSATWSWNMQVLADFNDEYGSILLSFGGEKHSKFAPYRQDFGVTVYKHLLIPGRLFAAITDDDQLLIRNPLTMRLKWETIIQSAVYGPKSLRKYAASIWSIFYVWL